MSKRSVGIKIDDNVKGTRLSDISVSGFDTPIEVGQNADVTLDNVSFESGQSPLAQSENGKGWSRLLEENWPWRKP